MIDVSTLDIVKSVTGSYKIKINVPRKKGRSDDLEEIEIDFEQPFRVIDMIPELEKILRIQLPDVNDIEAREGSTTKLGTLLFV
jgi:lysyl-tRNA synthetase class II